MWRQYQVEKSLAMFAQSSEDKRHVDKSRFRNRVIFRNVLNNWFTKQGPAEAVSERVMVRRGDQHLLQKYHSHSSVSHCCVSATEVREYQIYRPVEESRN